MRKEKTDEYIMGKFDDIDRPFYICICLEKK